MNPWPARILVVTGASALALAWRPLLPLDPIWARATPNVLLGFTLGLLIVALESTFRNVSGRTIAGGAGGMFVGLLGGTLATRMLPDAAADFEPFVLLAATYLGLHAGARAASEGFARRDRAPARAPEVLDTSAIIDGRAVALLETGLIEGPVLVPGFVLRELQGVADASEPATRERGRRGLRNLERVRESATVEVAFPEVEFPEGATVDDALARYAASCGGRLLTTDHNLARVAGIRGAKVTHVDAIADAMRPSVAPGERTTLALTRAGKEPRQAVGHLEDGTMVVVEDAVDRIGETLSVEITSALRTASGRMFFARVPE